ncbi:MAG: DUF1905 domain-containing protein [Saprospiraceae bacterium]|nr:DUF1905 domain-containing protein [Saprospiraceae bacterium]
MKLQTTLRKFESDLWGYHIPIPTEIAVTFIDDSGRRVLCTLNGQRPIHCALMPDGQGGFFINVNKELRKELNLKLGDSVAVELKKDKSKYGMPVPEELEALFEVDEEGNALFHQLTAGKQRSLIYLIGKPKRSDTRLQKAIVVLDYLKSTRGRLDYKELHQAFKDRKGT